jgi:hypothetical protein
VASTILDRIEVWGIPGPILNARLLLELIQAVHHLPILVARCSILRKELAIVEPHEGDHVIFQDFLVALPSHCAVLEEEVQTSTPLLATEAYPHDDRGGVLDGADGVVLLVGSAACSSSLWMASGLWCSWS